jgi:putative acetyltransferase
MLIRRETHDDIADIDAVHRAAFARPESDTEPPEVQLVHRLRADMGWMPALSLVAEDATSAVVGHVVCTVGSIEQATALGLGPLGVLPSHQRRGVGDALMHSVLGAADALGFPVVVLLGHVGYYSASASSLREASA